MNTDAKAIPWLALLQVAKDNHKKMKLIFDLKTYTKKIIVKSYYNLYKLFAYK